MSELPVEEVKREGFWARLCQAEDGLTCLALAALVLLPCSGIVLRRFDTGIEGASLFTTHLTLVIGMLGGMLAARERRLLSLSVAETVLTGWARTAVQVISSGVGASISFWLMLTSYYFVKSTPDEEVLAQGIKAWWVQSLLPVGFGVIALRILWRSAGKWRWRGAALAIAVAIVAVCYCAYVAPEEPPEWWPMWLASLSELEPEHLLWPGLVVLVAATLMGLPIFAMLGGAALLLFFVAEDTYAELAVNVAVDHYQVVMNPTFPSIPLFTLAGYFLAEAGSSRRLIRVFQALFGSLRGGPAIVTVAVCAFFTSFTGASGVTILALAALLMPVLLTAGYQERTALGLLTGAGSLGMLFPPCLPVILYAIVAEKPIEAMFLGGLVPGLLLVGITGAYGVWKARQSEAMVQHFELKEAWAAVYGSAWELAIPVVALVGIFSGYATPVEAAAVTALYAFVVEVCIYRDLKLWSDVPRAMAKCGLLVGGVLLILGVAMGFTGYLIDKQVPGHVVDWVQGSIESPLVFLLCLNLLLIIVGCLMDVFSAIIVMVPLIVPLGAAYGIDPIHLGIIFLANLELGYITPPIGMNLFLSSYRFNRPMTEICRAILPILVVQAVGVLLITYVPALTTWLPELIYGTAEP